MKRLGLLEFVRSLRLSRAEMAAPTGWSTLSGEDTRKGRLILSDSGPLLQPMS